MHPLYFFTLPCYLSQQCESVRTTVVNPGLAKLRFPVYLADAINCVSQQALWATWQVCDCNPWDLESCTIALVSFFQTHWVTHRQFACAVYLEGKFNPRRAGNVLFLEGIHPIYRLMMYFLHSENVFFNAWLLLNDCEVMVGDWPDVDLWCVYSFEEFAAQLQVWWQIKSMSNCFHRKMQRYDSEQSAVTEWM